MLETELKQLKLTDKGEIYFQPDPTNPLPGLLVGQIVKGESLLSPGAVAVNKDIDDAKVKEWLHAYVHEILAPLAVMVDEEDIQQPARDIMAKLHDALGILPRSALEESIAGLDEEGRRTLRQRKVRLGPVLVFLPMLSKPVSVRLRAVLWNIWNDKPLPALVPKDGVTSISVADADIDPLYYRSIGYPVYGKRAIRVDMLDRLIGAVYDSADKGVFKAQHAMAEWLGCPIADLYDVLEAMGHKKVHDPADEIAKEEAASEEVVSEEKKSEEKPSEEKSPEKKPEEKPELATFRLRKGRAYGVQNKPKKPVEKQQKPKFTPTRKPAQKKERKERVMSASAAKKMEDSPFAMLKDLKIQSKD